MSSQCPWRQALERLPSAGGVAGTAVAYMCFVTGPGRVTAAAAGTLSLAEPLVAAGLAVLLLGERVPAPVAAGSLLLLSGLVIVSVPARVPRGRPPARYDGAHVTGAVKVETTTGERK